MHRRFFVRPAGLLLGFAGFAGIVGFAALRKPSSPAMAVEGGEGDGAADNSRGSTMYRMKTSLGSFESLRRDAIRNRPSWPKGEAKSPSMAEEEKERERLRRSEAILSRELLRHLPEKLDRLKAILSREEALLYELKSKGIGNPQIWCPCEDTFSRLNDKLQTLVVYFDELKGIQESFDAVVTEQMKTSPGSSHYHDLEQKIKKLEQQNRECLDNYFRAFDELKQVFCETKKQMDEVTSSSLLSYMGTSFSRRSCGKS